MGFTCGGSECERYAASTVLQCIQIDLVCGARLQTLDGETEKFVLYLKAFICRFEFNLLHI